MSSYAPAAVPIWTLRRIRHLLNAGGALPVLVRLGGRLNQQSLVSAEGVVSLPEPLAGAHDGDLVMVEFYNTDTTGSPLTTWHIKRLQAAKVLVRAQKQTASRSTAGLTTFTGRHAEQWALFLQTTREFFVNRGLLEVTTPTMVRNPGMEPELEPFTIQWRWGRQRCNLHLATSPELHLKQMLVAGFSDIFEIKTVFRNEELTDHHEPEFQMLEWYRAYADLGMVKADLAAYVSHIHTKFLGVNSATPSPLPEHSVSEFFQRFTDFRLTPKTTLEELKDLAQKLQLAPTTDFNWNDLFHLIWVAKVEEHLPKEAFLLVDYPPSQAALARVNAYGWADRFELYMGGVEIANAFHELNDPLEQRRRFEGDQKKRVEYGRTPLEIDENFMAALSHGLPPSAGIALGLDRLFMRLLELKSLSATRAFGLSHQIP